MTQPSHLDGLNPEQLRAVTTTEGPVLVLAGAGSGKTGVLTRRIAHLISKGVDPGHIFAVTFTNKAAGEMKERVEKLVGEAGDKVWVSTFHSSCARILRQEIENLGGRWTKRFAIYDDDDQLRIVKEVVAQLQYDPERVPPKSVLSQIDHHKNRTAGTWEELVAQKRSHINDPLVRIWREYDDRLASADAIDFNDLIRLVVKLWETQPDALERWQERFRYILVDEYQDTNHTQYKLLKMLAEKRRNLMVVGDDDQSIYGFRGADISNILGFTHDWPDAAVIRLEQNYRSTKNILAVANAVVAQNSGRMEKKLWTSGEAGPKVTFIACESPRDEADRIARATQKLRRTGYQHGEMAIIYRTNAASRIFEAALREQGIPYRVVGGRKFYERREIRDVLSYLRLVVNPADDAALLRVVNVPSRGIGAKTLGALRDEASSAGVPLFRAAKARSGSSAADRALSAFATLIDELTDAARTEPPSRLVQRALDRSGYLAMLKAENSPESKGRIENLEELVRDALTFEQSEDAPNAMELLRAWLDRIALTGQDEDIPEGGMVTLMTVHNAKGLEYPVVFVVHMMEGLFPHAKSVDEVESVEEERRLAYVAFTRARKRLVISRSRVMPQIVAQEGERRGPPPPAPPSRFLFGLPADVCEGDLPDGEPATVEDPRQHGMEDVAQRKYRAFLAHHGGPPAARPAAPRAAPPPADEEDPIERYTLVELEDWSQLQPGVRILHPTRGIGVIVRQSGPNAILVSFAGRPAVSVTVRDAGLQVVRE